MLSEFSSADAALHQILGYLYILLSHKETYRYRYYEYYNNKDANARIHYNETSLYKLVLIKLGAYIAKHMYLVTGVTVSISYT